MSTTEIGTIERIANKEYKYGFVTEIESESLPKGLNEDIIGQLSAIKGEPEWMLDWRLKAYKHWLKMKEPHWPNVKYNPINYQDLSYYSAPKKKREFSSLEEAKQVDPELISTFEKLGISLEEQKRLSGVAVDAVFDSVSVATTFKETLAEMGIIFCSMSEAIRNHSDLVKKYIGSVVPYTDNFFASLNSAVFSDGSFVYIPKVLGAPWSFQLTLELMLSNTGNLNEP